MLKDNFYTILNKEERDNFITYSIELNPSHIIFSGHFPNNPVTPGVIQMEIVKELVSDHYKEKAKLLNMGNCKFLAILNPNENKSITVDLALEKLYDQIKVVATFKNDSISFLKMNANYQV